MVLKDPVGETVDVELLQVAAAAIDDRRRVAPELGRRRWRLAALHRDAIDAGMDVAADEVDDGIDVDALRHVGDEPDERRHADEGEQDGDGQRQVRNELAFGRDAHRAQHHQRVDEGADEGAKGDLIAAIAREVAQQPRAHLSRGQRQRGDGDREHRAGDGDGRGGDGAEHGARAGRTAAVEPGVLEQAAASAALDVIDA